MMQLSPLGHSSITAKLSSADSGWQYQNTILCSEGRLGIG